MARRPTSIVFVLPIIFFAPPFGSRSREYRDPTIAIALQLSNFAEQDWQ